MLSTLQEKKAVSTRLRLMTLQLQMLRAAHQSDNAMEFESLLNAAWVTFNSIRATSLDGSGSVSTTLDTTQEPPISFGSTQDVDGADRGSSRHKS
jgi:hypothetical protein